MFSSFVVPKDADIIWVEGEANRFSPDRSE
jgi:hypothetical protein